MRQLRPYIPLSVRVAVAERQLSASINDPTALRYARAAVTPLSRYLAWLLGRLFGEGVAIALDHDPSLAAREKVVRGGMIVGHRPHANDPDYLVYRTKEGHRVKTLVRGEHGQFSDIALIKRARRLERRQKVDTSDIPETKKSWFKVAKVERGGKKRRGPKLKGAARWPKKGTRKIARRTEKRT